MDLITVGTASLLNKDKAKYEMFGDETGTGWSQNIFFKNKPRYQLFDIFEVFLKKSLQIIIINNIPLDGESCVCRKPGFVVMNAPVHQDVHLDCKDVLKIAKNECFIYRVPLSPEGMLLRLSDVAVTEDQKELILFGRILFVPFGYMLLLPPTLIHSGHYGGCGNMRAHGIISQKNGLEKVNVYT